MRTNVDGIWAVGDVNGEQPFTRVAQLEGQIAYQDAFTDEDVRIDRDVLPHAIFTDPEIGSVGLTEAAAKAAGFDVEAATFPVEQVQRAFLAGEQRGAIKLVVERSSGRVLGCHVAARDGAELVYDAALVMRLGGTVGDLGHAVGTFPTMQEGIEGASRALAHSLHYHK
jgi:pyruvate/2-oxoglutarate dehydrogenase complex dihydrolipoamide dehydrogenase (E3) component